MVGVMGLAACAAPGDGGLALDDVDAALLAAECTHGVRCGEFETRDDCPVLGYPRVSPSVRAGIAIGAIRYDGDAAAACAVAIGEASCEQRRPYPSPCYAMLRGTRASGEACGLSEECGSGSCEQPACAQACCPGTCGPMTIVAALGESCAAAQCPDGAFCNEASVCEVMRPAGGTCRDDRDCAYGTLCDATHTCVALPAAGDACVAWYPGTTICGTDGMRCNTLTLHCEAVRVAGAACMLGENICGNQLTCDEASGRCIELPSLGEPCQSSCQGMAICDGPILAMPVGTCVPLQPNGAACIVGLQCASGYCANRTCADDPACH